jgi:hypothetical protein
LCIKGVRGPKAEKYGDRCIRCIADHQPCSWTHRKKKSSSVAIDRSSANGAAAAARAQLAFVTPMVHLTSYAAAAQGLLRGPAGEPVFNLSDGDVVFITHAVQADFFKLLGEQLLAAVDRFHSDLERRRNLPLVASAVKEPAVGERAVEEPAGPALTPTRASSVSNAVASSSRLEGS